MRDNSTPADQRQRGAIVHGDLHVTGTLTADGKLQIAQRAITGNTSDTASLGIDFVIHALHRRIDDLEARLAALGAAPHTDAPLRRNPSPTK
jgi:aminoglycoside phosphotransferase (APT) family kinase protein